MSGTAGKVAHRQGNTAQGFMIRCAEPSDAAGIADIYNYYVLHTPVSFEELAVGTTEMHQRMHAVEDKGLPWLVAEFEGKIAGYAYASPWRARAAYRYSVESSVYVDTDCCGRGLGTALLQALLDRLENLPVHVVIAGIALPNPASVALHEKVGMQKVSHHEDVGYKNGSWIAVGYWQLLLPLDPDK